MTQPTKTLDQAHNLRLLAHSLSQPRRRVTLWDLFERSVQRHPLAWTVGMILVAGLVATYIGN